MLNLTGNPYVGYPPPGVPGNPPPGNPPPGNPPPGNPGGNTTPPGISVSAVPASVAEMQVFTITGTFTMAYYLIVGSQGGDFRVTGGSFQGSGAGTWSVTGYFTDDNGSGTASDVRTLKFEVGNNLTVKGTASVNITVNNVNPSAQITSQGSFDEGSLATIDITMLDAFNAYGVVADSYTIVVDWGDGQTETIQTAQPVVPSTLWNWTLISSASMAPPIPPVFPHRLATHLYKDDDPTATPQDLYTVTVTITDDDTGTGVVTADILIKNVLPTLHIGYFVPLNLTDEYGYDIHPSQIDEGEGVEVHGTLFDPGLLDTHTGTLTVDVNYDGDTEDEGEIADLAFEETETPGFWTFVAVIDNIPDDGPSNLAWQSNGTPFDDLIFKAEAWDDDMPSGTPSVAYEREATVFNVAPEIEGFWSPSLNEYGIENGVLVAGAIFDIGVMDQHRLFALWNGQTEIAIPVPVSDGTGVTHFSFTRLFAPGEHDYSAWFPLALRAIDDDTGEVIQIVFLASEDPVPTIAKVEFIPVAQIDWTGVAATAKARYGKLLLDSNPNGDANDEQQLVRQALKQPAFLGGDRLFPDAEIATSTIGRNVVRVRATVTSAKVDDSVFFRSFDVDDPSSDKLLDLTDGGNDNRGRLVIDNIHAPKTSSKFGGGYRGRLRPVSAGNVLGGWAAEGASLESKVKLLKNAMGNVVMANGLPVLVAEVDLAASFAPGDNFRVGAHGSQKVLKGVVPTAVPTSGEKPELTKQLSVWRHVHVEVDAPAGISIDPLMLAGTTNRQQNRFADAYLEPEYDAINKAGTGINSTALAGSPFSLKPDSSFSDAAQASVAAAINSGAKESDVFWVAYVGAGVRLSENAGAEGIAAGVTANNVSAKPFDYSVIFDADITAFFTAANTPEVVARTAVHEVGHQLLQPGGAGADPDGHQGRLRNVVKYYNASDAVKSDKDEKWERFINVMNSANIQIPRDKGDVTLPLGTALDGIFPIEGNNSGPIDRFYFYAPDIDEMRSRKTSPGRF